MRPPRVRRIAIIGVGLIGGSVGLAARRAYRGARVIGVDRPAALRRARRRGAVHEGTASLRRALRDCDLVVLAQPIETILASLPRVARLVPPHALILDTGSTKGSIVRGAARAGLQNRFVGGHPMAGSERSGVEFADAGLFRGVPWILCPAGRGAPLAAARRVIRRLGARPVVLPAARHDRIVARLSHLPQLLSVALVNAAARGAGSDAFRLAGPAFRQMSRLAESSPRVWDGILRSNGAAIRAALDDLSRELRTLRASLDGGAAASFRRAARLRRARLRPAGGTRPPR
jgi:prephenate dehydrogenase